MSLVQVQGNASGTGTLTVAAPNTNSNYTLTLPTATTTLVGTDATQTLTNKTLTSPTITGAAMSSMASSVITSGTVQTAPPTTPQYFDFTGIPSWVKRITVMFRQVSTNGTSSIWLQIGDAGGIETTDYDNGAAAISGTTAVSQAASNAAFLVDGAVATTSSNSGALTLSLIYTNTWVLTGALVNQTTGAIKIAAGSKSLSDTLTQIRITTGGGINTFDAGSINILYE